MDAADVAAKHDFTEESLMKHSRRRTYKSGPPGTCLYCDEPITAGLYCDNECRTDYEREQLTKSRQHK